MLASRRKRLALRTIAVGGALVASLASAGAASAALGTGTPATFTNRPNLESVSFNGVIATFRFDKPVQPNVGPISAADFQLGGYPASFVIPQGNHPPITANIAVSDARNVLVTYGNPGTDDADFNATSFGAVAAGAVKGAGTFNNPNLADATRVTGSTSESGTRGHSAGPDLASVAVDVDNNRINYTFDQFVEKPAVNGAQFGFVNANGDVRSGNFGAAAVVNDVTVSVQYSNNPLDSVQSARQAFVTAGAAFSRDFAGLGAFAASLPIPGANPLTLRPMMTGAQINAASGTILYTFDQPIALVGPQTSGNQFFAEASDGFTSVAGTSATIVNGGGLNQVLVTYDTSQFSEQIVFGSAFPDAVTATNPGAMTNQFTGKPVGGNIGARATGYTTAPDAIASTFNPSSGQVVVTFDARLVATAAQIAAYPAAYQLLAADGTVIAPMATAATVETTTGPSQVRVFLQFIPQQVAVSSYVRVRGNVVGGGVLNVGGPFGALGTVPGGGPPQQNVETILTPSQTTSTFSAR